MQTLSEIQLELLAAYQELDASNEAFTEAMQVMKNLNDSVSALKATKDPDTLLAYMNIDKGLEMLLGIDAKYISAERATEGLSEAVVKTWDKIKELAIKVWQWIVGVVDKIRSFMQINRNANASFLALVASVDAKLFVKAMHGAADTKPATENIAIAEAFANDAIISYDKAVKLISEVEDIIPVTAESVKDDLTDALKVIEDNPSDLDKVIKLWEERTIERKNQVDEIRNEFNKLLAGCSEDAGTDYYDIGWDSQDKIKSFVSKYDTTSVAIDKQLKAIKESEKMVKDLVIKASGNIHPEDIYFDKANQLLDAINKWYVQDTKTMSTLGSNVSMVLSKCCIRIKNRIEKHSEQ